MKSLWDFLAQNHKGMINGRRWWAVFVEGAGNEEQPWDKHPEISKCAVLKRNDLSVFHFSPCPRLSISFESCHQKALRQWIHQRAANRHLQLLIIKSYPKLPSQFPSPKFSLIHTNLIPFPNIPMIFRRAGRWGEKQGRAAIALGRALEDETEIPRAEAGKGSALGTLQGSLTCCRNPSIIPEPSIHESLQSQAGAGTVPGRRMIIQSNLLPCQAAVCSFQLIKPKDWGEFHKLNP